jgi:O-antigen ligase
MLHKPPAASFPRDCTSRSIGLPFLRARTLPLAALMNGYVFYMAALHVIGVPDGYWHTLITAAYYTGLGFLALWFGIAQRGTAAPGGFDILMPTFFLVVLASLLTHGLSAPGLRYLPFVVIIPYISARLLNQEGILDLLKFIGCCGIAALALALGLMPEILQQWHVRPNRPIVFGHPVNTVAMATLIGSLLVLIIGFLLRPGREIARPSSTIARGDRWLAASILPLVYVLMVSGAKTSLIAAAVSVLACAAFATWADRRRRALVAVNLAGALCIGVLLVPANVKIFYSAQKLDQLGLVMLIAPPRVDFVDGDFQVNQSYAKSGTAPPVVPTGGSYYRVEPETVTQIPQLEAGDLRDNTMVMRALVYRQALEVFLRHPWLGVGAGNATPPHSTLLQYLAEFGLVGATPFVVFVAMITIRLYRIAHTPGHAVAVHAWLVLTLATFYLILDQSLGSLFASLPFFTLSGAGAAVIALARRGVGDSDARGSGLSVGQLQPRGADS